MAGFSGKESTCQCRRREFSPWGKEDPLEEEIATHFSILAWKILWTQEPAGYSSWVAESDMTEGRASRVAQMVKNLPTMQNTWLGSLGWEYSLEKEMAIHSSILA